MNHLWSILRAFVGVAIPTDGARFVLSTVFGRIVFLCNKHFNLSASRETNPVLAGSCVAGGGLLVV